jgi:hypothetical protein
LIYMLPVDSEEDLIAHIVEAATTWHFWAHMSVCGVVCWYWGWWPFI